MVPVSEMQRTDVQVKKKERKAAVKWEQRTVLNEGKEKNREQRRRIEVHTRGRGADGPPLDVNQLFDHRKGTNNREPDLRAREGVSVFEGKEGKTAVPSSSQWRIMVHRLRGT